MIDVISITSLDELIERINKVDIGKFDIHLFRGQRNEKWKLESGLFRYLWDLNKLPEFYILEQKELERFFAQSKNQKWKNHSSIQKISIAQHFHAKTRMLDWTEDLNVALYFSTEKIDFKSNAALFSIIISPWDLIPVNETTFPSYKLIRFINVQHILDDQRVINQKGWLSTQAIRIYPQDKRSSGDGLPKFDTMGLIEEDPYFNFKITKFIIPDKIKPEINNYLKLKGIIKEYIYP